MARSTDSVHLSLMVEGCVFSGTYELGDELDEVKWTLSHCAGYSNGRR